MDRIDSGHVTDRDPELADFALERTRYGGPILTDCFHGSFEGAKPPWLLQRREVPNECRSRRL